MFDDTGLPKSVRDDTDSGDQMDSEGPVAGPPRFGRLALCVAAVSALAIGVMGTVAYGVWFNHDQQAYVDAMVGARQALANTASATTAAVVTTANAAALPAAAMAAKSPSPSPAATGTPPAAPASVADPEQGGPLASWSGEVKQRSAPAAQDAAVADATAGASATGTSGRTARRAASGGNPPAQQLASARPGKEGRAAPQERRGTATNARHKDSLFARLGQFLRRVSYRQHGNASRQEPYSHP